MPDFIGIMITWTAYGTWLPGDPRSWRKRGAGPQTPRPLLAAWCAKQMTGEVVVLRPHDRETVEAACREHIAVRGWRMHAVQAPTNHVHVVVVANEEPETVRDQLKANCTRRLRTQTDPLVRERTWSRGGHCDVLEDEVALLAAVEYVLHGQDKPGWQAFGPNDCR